MAEIDTAFQYGFVKCTNFNAAAIRQGLDQHLSEKINTIEHGRDNFITRATGHFGNIARDASLHPVFRTLLKYNARTDPI